MAGLSLEIEWIVNLRERMADRSAKVYETVLEVGSC
jgi:hypothetical protein